MRLSIISGNPNSSARIQSYLVLAPILLMVLVVVGIEITSFGIAMYAAKTYVMSNEFIIVFGMTLSHHLAILFSRSKSQSITEIKGEGMTVTQTQTEMPLIDKKEEKKEEKPKEDIPDASNENA